ncbi:MAG: hypothetical protein ACI4XM_08060 [Candidatus Coprovivens sp.]
MGLIVKNKTSYQLGNNLTEFFSIPIEESQNNDEYSRLKDDIYKLNIDNEEKANILNKINMLNTNISPNKKKVIIKEIEKIKEDYNL